MSKVGGTNFCMIETMVEHSVDKLLLSKPGIYKVQAIPSSLHAKVKFIHGAQLILVKAKNETCPSIKLIIGINHSKDDTT